MYLMKDKKNEVHDVVEIDELAVSFKNGTWTFTPLHIEEDGSRTIAAHSCACS